MKKYKLINRTPVEVTDLMEWGIEFETADRHVANDEVDGIRISTVFLGLDHSFTGGPPILFETMIFGGDHDEWQRRYCTWDEAERGHRDAVAMVRRSLTNPKE